MNAEQRKQITEQMTGAVIETIEYDDEDRYWVMTLSDGSETSFRFMADIVRDGPPETGG
jgi:hypothetical protein